MVKRLLKNCDVEIMLKGGGNGMKGEYMFTIDSANDVNMINTHLLVKCHLNTNNLIL